jgi:hypothetical protein
MIQADLDSRRCGEAIMNHIIMHDTQASFSFFQNFSLFEHKPSRRLLSCQSLQLIIAACHDRSASC